MLERLRDPIIIAAIVGAVAMLVNLIIDKVLAVPADNSPGWAAFVERSPRAAGIVKVWRGWGPDLLKGIFGILLAITGKRELDASHSVRPPPPEDP